MNAPAAAPRPPQISSFRLLGTMGSAGAVAGLLIVLVYQATLPTVQANRAARLETAIQRVLPGLARYDTLYLVDNALTAALPPGVDGRKVEKIYRGVGGDGREIGFAIPVSEPGFQDAIEILFGFAPAPPATLGLVILGSRETPGLGDKIEAPQWLAQFDDARTPLVAVKSGAARAPEDVDMITGATISSRTVITAVNKGVARWAPLIETFRAGGGS
jgi:Na+-translocating ferredoxin:NAD+ oxidoreductase subunit G